MALEACDMTLMRRIIRAPAALLVAAVTAAGCSSSTAPGSPTVAAGQVSGQLAIAPLATDAVVVGASAQLVPVITLGDSSQPQPADAVAWSSSPNESENASATRSRANFTRSRYCTLPCPWPGERLL